MPGFQPRSTRSLLDAGFLEVVEEELEDPSGELLTRYVVRHPGAVVVVPVDDESRVVLVRQYRVAARAELLEVPAGKREPGEEPEATARRELEEEVGLVAGRLVKLAEFYNSPGFCDEYSHVYLGLDLTEAPRADYQLKAEERHMRVERIPLVDIPALVAGRGITDAKSLVGTSLAADYLAGRYGGVTQE